jgi:hypothetical protein
MNCANHPEIAASAFCRECGKPMCTECQRPALGSIFCEEHAPVTARVQPPVYPPVYPSTPPPVPPPPVSRMPFSQMPRPEASRTTYAAPASPYTAPYIRAADPSVHPILALILGFAPGVGAIYNGQYAKGLVHAVVFGLMVSIENNTHNSGLEALVGIMIAAWVIYQAFEAYHTARKRRYGLQVEEFSSLFDVRMAHGRFPAGAILLIGLGFILLLDTTDIISIDVFTRYWPALLIFFGLYLLYARMNPAPPAKPVESTPFDSFDGGTRQ